MGYNPPRRARRAHERRWETTEADWTAAQRLVKSRELHPAKLKLFVACNFGKSQRRRHLTAASWRREISHRFAERRRSRGVRLESGCRHTTGSFTQRPRRFQIVLDAERTGDAPAVRIFAEIGIQPPDR